MVVAKFGFFSGPFHIRQGQTDMCEPPTCFEAGNEAGWKVWSLRFEGPLASWE